MTVMEITKSKARQRGYLPECFLIREIEEIDIRNFEEVSE